MLTKVRKGRQAKLIKRAAAYCGGQTELAERMSRLRGEDEPAIYQGTVSKWRAGITSVPLDAAIMIDIATDGTVRAEEFHPLVLRVYMRRDSPVDPDSITKASPPDDADLRGDLETVAEPDVSVDPTGEAA